MEWSKKMLVFWERSLASGFTVGVILVSLLLVCFLVSVDNQPITTTSSSPSSFSSLFSFLNPHSSFPNSTTTLSANTSNNTVLERIDGRNETDSWPTSSNYSVIEPKFGNNQTQILNFNNSANAVPNTTLTQENFPLEEQIGGNLGCNNTSTSNIPSCNATESDPGNIIKGTDTTQVEKSSNHSGNADVISTGTIEISQRNSTTNTSSVISTLSPSSNTSLFPLNVVTDRNASSTIENISVAKSSLKNETNVDKGKNFSHSFIGTNKASLSQEKCDIFDGKWVRDESYPLYPPGSCPYIDDDFNCYKNGRHDHDFLNWRWQPNQCNIPRLNATDFLERLRGKRLLFVGDSLNRNMWESLVCALRHGVSDKSKVFETSGKKRFKTSGYYSFRFKDYKCYVDFVRSTFLVKEFYQNNNNIEEEKLRLDMLDETTIAYHKADIIIFNTGHWWTHEKTSKGINYYQEGNYVYPSLKVLNAYQKALTTWAKWVDNNINPSKTQVVFRGYSLTHFKGGQWNSGGQCHKETEPIFNETYLSHYPSKMRALQNVLREMKTPVIYLNISRLTDYRKDAHPSIYRKKYNSIEEQIAAEKSQDCSHWCLPGVPDLWNELLYASLLKTGKGSWRN